MREYFYPQKACAANDFYKQKINKLGGKIEKLASKTVEREFFLYKDPTKIVHMLVEGGINVVFFFSTTVLMIL